jgi:hypothetical protein
VVQVAAAVEDDGFEVRLLRPLGQQLADLGRLLGLVALERFLQVQRARRREGLPSPSSTSCASIPAFERKTTRRGRSAVP